MGDPSHRVEQPLLNHVHLISGHRFPTLHQLSIEDAYRYLLDAPQIVKQRAPVSWTYVQAPADNTLWLEWLSPSRDNRFPSDGYVWCDQEQPYRQDLGAYKIEIFVHSIGYRPGFDQMTSHARTRYRFISKQPNANGPPPDPSLWIVHYHQANPNQVLPVTQAPPITRQQHQILSERKWFESQGRLDKKDFMLHDQEHWPVISVPVAGGHMQRQMQQPGYYGQPGMAGQMGRQPPYQQPPGGYPQQPPQKRQRHSGPIPPPGAPDVVQDTTLEDEENTTLGDFFDHLTPRDISLARYMQHHRWMEEVFSSPYASHQIVPVDLGLGLMGELRGLTEGILDPPSLDFLNPDAQKPFKAVEAQPFTHLKQDQVEQFNKRVEEHLAEGRADIERMKAEHATKMQEWKKTKALMQAEKRLRHATWEGDEERMTVFRVEDSGQGENGATREHAEEVVKEVEQLLGVKIRSHQDAAIVAKGGLEEEPEQPRKLSVPNGQSDEQLLLDASNDAGGEVEASLQNQPNIDGVQGVTQPSQGQANYPPQLAQESSTTNDLNGANDDADGLLNLEDDALMEGMDLDMGEPEMEFDMSHVDTSAAGATPQQTTQAETATSTGQNTNSATTENVGSSTSVGQAQPQAQQTGPAPPAPSGNTGSSTAGGGDGAEESAQTGVPDDNDDSMFQDNPFDDLTNMDGDNDGLIDFDGGMDMGDGEFGDALHGMDSQEGGQTGGS